MLRSAALRMVTALQIIGVFVFFVVMFIVPEYLIFGFDEEARRDWVRMLPAAVTGPFVWMVPIILAASGIGALFMSLKTGNPFAILLGVVVSFSLVNPGVRIPHYWVQRIVLDDVPAFGMNPNNIYAVTGLNSIGLWFIWAFQGARASLPIAVALAALAAIIWVLRRFL